MMWRVMYPFARLVIGLRSAWRTALHEAKERPGRKNNKSRAFVGFGVK